MKYGFVIPVYRHGSTLEAVVKGLLSYNFPIIVVDDGNDEEKDEQINRVAEAYSLVTLVTRQKNGGKGKAMFDGIFKRSYLVLVSYLLGIILLLHQFSQQ